MSRLLALACLSLLSLSALAARPQEREPLELTFLANEGFMAKVGEHALLFDSFLAQPYAGYPALPKDVLAKLRKAEAPFADIDLALTSHVHGDHFQQAVARDFLLASKATPLASTPQVVEQLKQTEGWPSSANERLVARYPEAGAVAKHSFGEIRVQFLRVPHGGMPEIENLGTLVEVGGHTLLHLGDAAMEAEVFAPYAEQLAQVDLALVPFWFFSTKEGQAILERYLPAKARVAMHFPKRDNAKVVGSFLDNHEGVLAFSKAMQSHRFQ